MARRKPYEEYVNDEVLEKIKYHKKRGLRDEEIYKMIGIGATLGKKWKNEHEAFLSAFKIGVEESLIAVENAYYKRAVGYYVNEIEVTEEKDATGRVIKTVTKKKRKFVWSDNNAYHILRRRNPEYWGENLENQNEEETAIMFNRLKEVLKG